MRILYLVKNFNFGGAENHVRDLANVIDGTGNNVFIIAKSGMQNNLLNTGVKFFSLWMNDFLIPFHVLFVVIIIRKYKIHVLHAHQRLPILIGSIAGKITGIPVVVTVHGQTRYDLRSRLSKRIPYKFIYVSQRTFPKSAGFSNHGRKSVVIQNGVSISMPGNERDYYSLCYISRIDKKHYSLISMIISKVLLPLSREYTGIIFNIVGDGDYMEDLRNEADKINSQLNRKMIVFHGYLPDVRGIIKKSGLVFGVGRVAIETLACGVPLLSVNQKYFGGLVSRENYTYLSKSNFVSVGSEQPTDSNLIAALRDYFSNIDLWQNESVQLQKRIDEDFNMLRIANVIMDIYKEAIEMKGKPCSRFF